MHDSVTYYVEEVMTMSAMTSRAATGVRAPSQARRPQRAIAVATGVAAAFVVWGIAEMFGVDVRQPAFQPNAAARDMAVGSVIVASGVSGLAGWLSLAALERLTARARPVWLLVASLTLLMSLGGPISGEGIEDASRVVLVLMHLAVGGTLLALLGGTSPPARGGGDGGSET